MSFDFFVRQRLLPAGRLPACVCCSFVFSLSARTVFFPLLLDFSALSRPAQPLLSASLPPVCFHLPLLFVCRVLPEAFFYFITGKLPTFPSAAAMPAPSVLFPIRFCPLGFAVFVRSPSEPFLLPRCPCTDFSRRRFFTPLPGNSPDSFPLRPPCSPLPSGLFSFRFCPLGLAVFVRSLTEPFLLPRCPCIDFSRRRFLPRYREIPRLYSLCGRHACPFRPVPYPFLSARFRRFVRSLSELFSLPAVAMQTFCLRGGSADSPGTKPAVSVFLSGPVPSPFGCSVLPLLYALRPSFCLPRPVSVVRFCLPCRLRCRPACPFSVRSFFRGKTRS